jgi:hypothetical protein
MNSRAQIRYRAHEAKNNKGLSTQCLGRQPHRGESGLTLGYYEGCRSKIRLGVIHMPHYSSTPSRIPGKINSDNSGSSQS